MFKTKPVSLVNKAVASVLVALMALPNIALAQSLRQITLATPEPATGVPRVTLQLAPPPGATGGLYTVQTSTNLVDWETLQPAQPNAVQLLSVGPLQALDRARFFRAAALAGGGQPGGAPVFAAASDDNGRVFQFPYLGGGTWGDAVQIDDFGGSARGVAIGDFDRDGLLDIVASGPSGNTLRPFFVRGLADGTFADPQPMPTATGVGGTSMDMATGDFDVDGNPDVVINANSNPVYFYWGRGDGTFTLTVANFPGGSGRGMTAGDFNEDGRTDLARATYSDGIVRQFLSNGDRTFTETNQIGDAGVDPYGVVAGDFDRDGHLDLIANEGSSGNIVFFKGFGDATFTNVTVGDEFASLDFNDYAAFDTYDFNEDGVLDLVVSTYNGRSAYYLPGLATGGFDTNRVTLKTGMGASLGVAAPPPPPRVDVSFTPRDPVIDLNGQVTFTAGGSGVQAGDTFRWTFGDQGDNPLAWTFTPDMANAGPQVTHAYVREGRFVTRLWHTSAQGIQSTRGTWVTVRGQPPIARPGGPYVFDETAAKATVWTATLDGSASTDDFGIVSYEWSFGDGTGETNTVPTVTKSWTNVGPWTVQLVVEDAAGLRGTNNTTVTFEPGAPPVAQITGPSLVDETAAKDGQWTVNFSGAQSSDDVGIWKYEWQYGDGKTGTGRDVTTKYGAVGTYTVTLMVTDNAGQANTNTHEVTIQANDLPVPVITGPRLLTEVVATNGLWYGMWDAKASTDDTGIYRYQWDFGDGSTASGAEVTHQYDHVGTFTLSLKVTDNGNQTATNSITVVVVANEKPVARITASPLTPEGAQPVNLSGELSTDDRGITAYRWLLPPRTFDFTGRAIDAGQWASVGATQDDKLLVTGTGGWGRTYFFSLPLRVLREGALTGRIDTPTDTSHAMVGLKNLDLSSGHFGTYVYAIYFEDGRLSIYEYGGRRANAGDYVKGQSYEFRIVSKPGAGADYYLRPAGTGEEFALLYSSDQRADTAFGFGADVNAGTFGFDDFTVTRSFIDAMTVSTPVFPGGQVVLEVVDHGRQTNSASVTINPLVGQPPVAAINGPTSAQTGAVLSFDAYRSSDDHGIASYTWDFGDGTELGFGPVVNHRYDSPGRYTNTVTVLDYANQSASASLVIDVTAGNAVVCVPWRIVNGIEQPHETYSGKEVSLKAVARGLPLPFDAIWDFGDGSGTVTNTVTSADAAYGLEARHTYSGTEGTPFYATISVVLTNGAAFGDTYPLVLRPKSLTTEMNVAIDEGLWFLHKSQTRSDLDAQNRSGLWQSKGYRVNVTATAVQAFGINGHQYSDDSSADPYVETVQRGIHYLLTTLVTQPIGPQDYGDPDGNQNGIGLFTGDGQPIYQTGPLMDGLVACTRPELIAPVGPPNVKGRALRDIMQDLVDTYCWGQYDDPTVGGGWRYNWNQHPDNSAAQWGAIGLTAAEKYWSSTIPTWVKERNIVWVQYSKGNSGFGYTGPGDGEALTPSAMVQLAFDEVPTTDDLWQHGQTYLARNWNSLVNGHNLYAHYAIAKALRTAHPQPVDKLSWNDQQSDWFLDPTIGLARFTVDQQRADGSWQSRDGWVNEPPISTAYSIVILSSSLFQRGPVAVIQFRPNPSAVGFPVVFDARASYHQHPAYKIVDYRWDFSAADGFDFDHPDAVGPVVTNVYGALGTNVVTLQVRDNSTPVLTDIASVEVRTTIPPFPPTADAGGPYLAAVGEDLHLDGSGSFDVDESAGDYITAWDWEIDFVMPLDYNDGVTGEKPVFAGGFATPGQHRIGLRVADATSIVFPQLGLTNLTSEDFATAFIYERVVTDLQTRPKENKIQLTWTKAGDYAAVLRSTAGPDRGFVEIGRTDSDYATFLDTNVVMNTEYFYRVVAYSNSRPEPIGVSDGRLAVSRGREFDNLPPKFQSTPLRLAQVGRLYEVTLDARDPENDPLNFALLSGPTNLTVNPTTGVMEFTPTEDQLGSQAISVEVSNASGRDVLSYTVVVFPAENTAPTAAANGPYAGLVGEAIQFSSAGTADPDGNPLRLIWNFGDGTSSTNANPAHVYAGAGSYLVSLYANDGYGGTASARANVTVSRPNRPPTAQVAGGPDFTLRLGETLELDGSGSFDLDGDPMTFTWVWGDGGTDTDAAAQITHTYAAEGTFNGQLIVADNRGGAGTNDFTATVGPANRPPVIVVEISDPSPLALQEITFDATATTDADGDPLTFEWDFGDRTRTTGPLVTHVFRDIGVFTVTLTVRDNRGGSATDTLPIEARNSPAAVTSQPGLLVRAGKPYSYLPDARDPNGDALTFSLAEGPATMTVNPTTGAIDWLPGDADVGPHPVVLRVTDARGAVIDQSFTLVVTTPLGPEIDLEPLAIVMTNVTVDPQSLALGGTVRVELRNNGADEVPVPFTVSVFVDADGDGAFTTNSDRVVAFGNVPAGLQQGFVGWIEMGVRGQAQFAGAPLSAYLDSENVVPEYDESNNIRRAGFNLDTNAPPVVDLTASRLQVDRSGLPAQAGLTARLGNAGLVPVPAGAAMAFYSDDPLAGGALIGVAHSTRALAPGQFEDLSVIWASPTIAAYTVFVAADDAGDGTGAYAEISEVNNRFSAPVDLTANEPPVADAGPDQTVALGDYAVFNGRGSRDPEGKTLTYRWTMVAIPVGSRAGLNAADTEQAWLQPDVAGHYTVQLVVNDGVNDSAPDTIQVTAEDPTANHPPDITSRPDFQGMATVLYEYAIAASDPDGDPLTYRLGQAPSGMTIDAATGVLRWTPTAPGAYFVQAIVQDNRGAGRSQSWSLTILEYRNLPPQFTSTPVATASPGVAYAYPVTVTDPNRDPVTLALTQGPAGMTLDAGSGRVNWTPTTAQFGSHPVVLTATDGKGGSTTQRFDVVVFDAATDGPVVRSIPDQTVVGPAAFAAIPLDTYVFDPNNADNEMTWTVSGTNQFTVTIDADRVATVTYPDGVLASERITFLATDPTGKSGFASATFTVRGADNPPIAALDNLSAETTTRIETGFFELRGTADDPDAIDPVAYRVTLHDENGAQLADVTPKPVTAAGWHEGRVPAGGSLGSLDLTLVRNGTYTLNLTVRGGNQTVSAAVLVAIDSGLKIGQFTFSQLDATVPVGGTILRLVRTYDSLNTKSADFGYSWVYAVSDLGIEVNEQRVREQDLFGEFFSLRVGGGRDVTLDMPDTGRRVTFTYSLAPGNLFRLRAGWTAPPGVNATLVPTVSPNMIKLFSLPAYWEAAGLEVDVENFDFPGFILTLQDGTQYRVEREDLGEHFIAGSGSSLGTYVHAYGKPFVRQVLDPTKARTEFVHEKSGLKSVDEYDANNQKLRSLVFQRDAQGRIVGLFTPANVDATGAPSGPAAVTYEYDATGNLVRVNKLVDESDSANPVYQTTTFVYGLPRFPHFLTEIQGPNGNTVLRVEFDADGRMIGTVDALGHRQSLSRNITGRTETVVDRLGNATTHVYDDRGNIVVTTDPLGRTTLRTFDAKNRQTSETDALGRTTTLTYGDGEDPLTVTDYRGRVTRYTYDADGRLLTATDPNGLSVGHEYDDAGNLLATIDTAGRRSTLQYDAQSRLLAALDPAGNTIASFGYNDRGSMASITNGATGTDMAFQEDPTGNLLSSGFTWRNPADTNDVRELRAHNEYDAAGRPVRRTDFAGNTLHMAYNEFGQITSTTDDQGQAVRYVYDSRGNPIETRFADGTLTRVVYDEENREILSTERAPAGQPANGVQSVRDAVGRTIRQDLLTNVVVAVVTNGAVVQSVLQSAGGFVSSTTYEYDEADRVTREVRPDSGETRIEYDLDNNPLARIDALGNRTEFEYDAKGQLMITRDAQKRETFYTYDSLGRLISMIHPDGSSTQWTYDEDGRLVAQTSPGGTDRRFEYSALGKLSAIELPEVTAPDNPGATTRPRYEFDYDAYGNPLVQRDAQGRETRFAYDPLNRPVSRTLPLGQTETTEYDASGRPLRRVDFMGQTTQLAYDPLGRLTNKVSLAAGSTQPTQAVAFAYDDWSRPATVTDARGETRFSYDAYGHVASIAAPEATVHYEYDPATSQRLRAYTDQTDVRYAYDELGRLQSATWVARNGAALAVPETVTYEYTATGSRAAMTLPNGTKTRYQYDARDRLTLLTHTSAAGELLASYAYQLSPDNLRTAATEVVRGPAGDYRTNRIAYSYDTLMRLVAERAVDAADGVGYEAQYAYDLVGNRLERQVTAGGRTLTTRYTYDANDRLLSETNSVSLALAANGRYPVRVVGAGGAGTLEWRPLPTGFGYHTLKLLPYLLALSFLVPAFLVPRPVRRRLRLLALELSPQCALFPRCVSGLLAALMVVSSTDLRVLADEAARYQALQTSLWGLDGSVTTYEYDENGSVTRKVVTGPESETATYQYDLDNRLTEAINRSSPGGIETVQTQRFTYTSAGTLVGAETSVEEGGAVVFTDRRVFVIDSGLGDGLSHILEERSAPNGPVLRTFFLGDDPLAEVGSGLTGEAHYYLADGHGSTRQLVGALGVPTDTYAYDAYGVMLGDSPSPRQPSASSLLYAGERFDAGLQQYQLRARFYDPANGRFTQMDPFGGVQPDPQSLHKYAYAHGDPVNRVDPSGLFGSLSEVATSLVIQSILFSIASLVLSPILRYLGAKFLPDWAKKLLEEATPSAFLAGVGLAGVYRVGSLNVALELLISPHTWSGALFFVAGGGIALAGKGAGGGIAAYAGMIFNAPSSGAYAGHALSISMDWNSLSKSAREKTIKWMAQRKWTDLIQTAGLQKGPRKGLLKALKAIAKGKPFDVDATWALLTAASSIPGLAKPTPTIAVGSAGTLGFAANFWSAGVATRFTLTYGYAFQVWPYSGTDPELLAKQDEHWFLGNIWFGNVPDVPFEKPGENGLFGAPK